VNELKPRMDTNLHECFVASEWDSGPFVVERD
jgi:hypothetical protein